MVKPVQQVFKEKVVSQEREVQQDLQDSRENQEMPDQWVFKDLQELQAFKEHPEKLVNEVNLYF